LVNVTGLSIENVPRELASGFREVLDNCVTIHAEPYGEPAPSPSSWPKQHEVGSGAILPCNYIDRPLPLTFDKKLSLLTYSFQNKSRKCLKTNVL